MNVSYKCGCMDAEVTIAVPDRRDGQDIVDWMENVVGEALGRDHRARSPQCRSDKTEYVKIEIDQSSGMIGRMSKQ